MLDLEGLAQASIGETLDRVVLGVQPHVVGGGDDRELHEVASWYRWKSRDGIGSEADRARSPRRTTPWNEG